MASPNPETVQRFLDALAQVDDSGDAAVVRRALQTILHEAVEQIWAGDADAAARYLEAMEPAMPRVRAALASLPEDPVADAARYTQMVMQALRVADRALDSARIEVELTSVSSTSKRDVLRILHTKGGDQYLSRSDVGKLMSSQELSNHRIGQILDEFHALHLVTRVELTRRGGRAAHYRLAPAGRELCARLLHEAVDTAVTADSNALTAEAPTEHTSGSAALPAERVEPQGTPQAPSKTQVRTRGGRQVDVRDTVHLARDLVFETYRDKLPELVAYLPNIESITVERRTVHDDGSIELVNRWQAARTEVPAVSRPFIKPEFLEWYEYATWDSKEHVCRWRTELVVLGDVIHSEGVNYYRVLDENSMEVHLTGIIGADASRIPGVPRMLAGKVASAVELGVIKVIEPNLRAVNRGLEQYLAEWNAQQMVNRSRIA